MKLEVDVAKIARYMRMGAPCPKAPAGDVFFSAPPHNSPFSIFNSQFRFDFPTANVG